MGFFFRKKRTLEGTTVIHCIAIHRSGYLIRARWTAFSSCRKNVLYMHKAGEKDFFIYLFFLSKTQLIYSYWCFQDISNSYWKRYIQDILYTYSMLHVSFLGLNSCTQYDQDCGPYGSCEEVQGRYYCRCRDGYSGERCESKYITDAQ